MLSKAMRLITDARATSQLSLERRRRWIERLHTEREINWPGISSRGRIGLGRWVRCGAGGLKIKGYVRDTRGQQLFWIKWCPAEMDTVLASVFDRTKWWRARHPGLREKSADFLACWPDENLLVLEGRRGQRMSRLLTGLRDDSTSVPLQALCRTAESFGQWLHDFAKGHPPYDPSVSMYLAIEAETAQQGQFIVDARRVLEHRLSLAEHAVSTLSAAGLEQAGRWTDRFDIDMMLQSLSTAEAGGFIHGDMTPANILIDGSDFSVIDWWNGPLVRWPLIDVAVFAANLWLLGRTSAVDRVWSSFARGYFRRGIDERTREIIDLIGVTTCLNYLASRIQRGVGKALDRPWCASMVDRLIDQRTVIGRF